MGSDTGRLGENRYYCIALLVLVCYANVVLLVQKLLCEILCAIYKCIAAVFLEINSNTV